MKKKTLYGNYFCGNEISEYGKENGYLDYATFAKAFDAVFNDNIMQETQDVVYWEPVQLGPDYSDEIDELQEKIDCTEDPAEIEKLESEIAEYEEMEQDFPEVYQYYIVSDTGAELIQEYTDDPLWYNEQLDMYIWGVTHWGTSWDYVLTNVKCNTGEFQNRERGKDNEKNLSE